MSFLPKRLDGQQAAAAPLLAAHCYLLDGDFSVLSAQTGEENAAVGTSFFEIFPTNRILRAEIDEYALSYPQDALLALCNRMPVLFLGGIFAKTGLILALLPQGAVKRTLSAPAVFHRVPPRIRVSASAQMRYKAHDEAALADACRWLRDAAALLSCVHAAESTPTSVLSARANAIAALLGVPLCCDFSGWPAHGLTEVDLDFALGVLLASAMAAARSRDAQGVRVYAAMEGAPMLYLSFTRTREEDGLPELSALSRCALARGAILDVVASRKDPCVVQVRVGLGTVELSAQGVRERHRFLEGESPPTSRPSAFAIPLDFPDLSFD